MLGSVESQTPSALTFFWGHLKSFSGRSLRSKSLFEPIDRASVFLILSLRPDMLPKVCIKITDSKKDSSEPSRISVVSSASWLNLKSMPLISMPLILCFFRMSSASISADRINRHGDKGQPCLTPRLSLKKLLAHPLFRIQLSILQ